MSSTTSTAASAGPDQLPSFDIDTRGWTIIHAPANHHYRIRVHGDKVVDIPAQKEPIQVTVNPVRSMPDEWTIGGVTMFIHSPGNE